MDIKSLYHIYNADQLVFIVGSEILKMNDLPRQAANNNGGQPANLTFEEAAIQRITNIAHPDGPKTFSSIAIDHPETNISSNSLVGVFRSYQMDRFDLSLINMIANLPRARMIIQTSFDPFLKEALGDRADVHVWNHRSENQILLDTTNKKQKLLFLFGDTEKGISLFEEEQVDCLLKLSIFNEKGKKTEPRRYSVLEYLSNKTLVFIGNNFSDWFMRLMIRTLYNRPMDGAPEKVYIINDNEGNIRYGRYFFNKFNIRLIHERPIVDFLGSFLDLVNEQSGFDSHYGHLKVFICYDRQDTDVAQALKKELNSRYIDVFLDTANQEPGEHDIRIKGVIQARETCFFIPVLSQSLMGKSRSLSYVKREEWPTASDRYALNKYMEKRPDKVDPTPFLILPMAVDDFNVYKEDLPDFIIANQIFQNNIIEVANVIEKAIKEMYHVK